MIDTSRWAILGKEKNMSESFLIISYEIECAELGTRIVKNYHKVIRNATIDQAERVIESWLDEIAISIEALEKSAIEEPKSDK